MKSKFNLWYNPYYWWWQVRKYFKRPRLFLAHFGIVTWFYGLPIKDEYYSPIIDIHLTGLGWKTKYDSPRHEWNPFLAITLFRKFQVIWMWDYYPKNITEGKKGADGSCISLATWEAILDMAVFNKTIKQVYLEHQWLSNDRTLTIRDNLRSKWRKLTDTEWKEEQ